MKIFRCKLYGASNWALVVAEGPDAAKGIYLSRRNFPAESHNQIHVWIVEYQLTPGELPWPGATEAFERPARESLGW